MDNAGAMQALAQQNSAGNPFGGDGVPGPGQPMNRMNNSDEVEPGVASINQQVQV